MSTVVTKSQALDAFAKRTELRAFTFVRDMGILCGRDGNVIVIRPYGN